MTARAPAFAARPRSASAQTIVGDLPPSSRWQPTIRSAATRPTLCPAATDPVNAMCRTSSCPTSAAPTVGPSPRTMLHTPAGKPASTMRIATRLVVSGVSSDGLTTTVFPAARHGATPRIIWLIGAFHGVMWATTPYGSRTV